MNPLIKHLFDQSKRLGISNYEISKRTGVDEAQLSRMKKGTSSASIETLQKIGEYVGWELTWKEI